MPIKKDGTGKRWVEIEILVPGTPEEVWRAVATGPGMGAWFTKAEIEERVGGVIRFDFGGDGSTTGEVTKWEPPHAFGYVENVWQEGAPPVATEITITARAGGKCVFRMVHSLFTSSDDWDDQVEGFESGWPAFLEVLRVYLARFAGQPASPFLLVKRVKGQQLALWKRMIEGVGLVGADVGDSRTSAALSGTVERVFQNDKHRWVMVRGEPASLTIFGTYEMGDVVNVSVTSFHYGADADARAKTARSTWDAWLSKTFPAEG